MGMKHWAETERQLRLALAQLNYIGGTEQAEEYLNHNELFLAWEELQQRADSQGVVLAEFWRPMAKAAGLMLAASYE